MTGHETEPDALVERLEKRDCELVNQAECVLQMLPKEKNDD